MNFYYEFELLLKYKKKRIIEADLIPTKSVDLTSANSLPDHIPFRYIVKFERTDLKFRDRMNRYTDLSKKHYTSMISAFLIVIVLTLVAFYILIKTLKADMIRYFPAATQTASKSLGLDRRNSRDMFDLDYGWKLVQGDVFRAPSNLMAFSSFIGSGIHLASTVLLVLIVVNFDYLFDLGFYNSMFISICMGGSLG